MSSLREKMNEKKYRVCKEEYYPFREKYAMWTVIVGILVGLVGSVVTFIVFKRTVPLHFLLVMIGVVLFITGIFMVEKSYYIKFTVKEVLKGKLICYEYDHYDKETRKETKKVFESFSDAEMAIEKLKEKTEDLELEPLP